MSISLQYETCISNNALDVFHKRYGLYPMLGITREKNKHRNKPEIPTFQVYTSNINILRASTLSDRKGQGRAAWTGI